jgi:hypothetical protein
MKQILLLFVAILVIGCENPYAPVRTKTAYEVAPPEKIVKKEEAMPVMLAPIDETKVYIWNKEARKVYDFAALPESDGDILPMSFYFEDGTVADITDFNFYRPNRHFYIKVKVFEPVEEEGIVVRYQEVERMFRQKNGVVQEMPANSLFPADLPPELAEATYGPFYTYAAHWFSEPCLVIKSSKNDDKIDSSCSHPLKYLYYMSGVGERCWFVGQLFDMPDACLFYMASPTSLPAPVPCTDFGVMTPVRVVYK